MFRLRRSTVIVDISLCSFDVPLAHREPLTEDHRCSNSGIGAWSISSQRCPASILNTTSLLESAAVLRVKTSNQVSRLALSVVAAPHGGKLGGKRATYMAHLHSHS